MMPGSPAVAPLGRGPMMESRETAPEEVTRLLASAPGPPADAAWSAFVSSYSELLLRVAADFGPGYDGALDRYAYMLDELRRNGCRRLRGFSADGRGRFSTWLVVVARRLCLDHYRLRYGRSRGTPPGRPGMEASRATRRCLSDLAGAVEDLAGLADPALPDPGERLDDEHRRSALGRAVAGLSPSDQLLLRLRFEDELTAREIARLLGLPTPFHVYRRLSAVCTKLRLHLESAAGAQTA
jgi:RNA polymerase sigma factor (sigma-70 family)